MGHRHSAVSIQPESEQVNTSAVLFNKLVLFHMPHSASASPLGVLATNLLEHIQGDVAVRPALSTARHHQRHVGHQQWGHLLEGLFLRNVGVQLLHIFAAQNETLQRAVGTHKLLRRIDGNTRSICALFLTDETTPSSVIHVHQTVHHVQAKRGGYRAAGGLRARYLYHPWHVGEFAARGVRWTGEGEVTGGGLKLT